MGSQQQFDVVATVHEITKRNSQGLPTETRVLSGTQAPVPVYSISSGPATVVGSRVTCGYLAQGASPVSVTIRAIVMSSHYMTTSKETTFTIDSSKTGQRIELINEKDGKGGFRPIPISPRPIFIGKIFKSTSGLAVSYSITGDSQNVAQIIGSGNKAALVIGGKNGSFSGFPANSKEITFTVTASQVGNGQYHAAADIDRVFTIKKPGKNAYYEERRSDLRFDTKKQKFKMRFPGISSEKSDYFFSSDAFDSDGDGLTNLEERAFGGDSLGNDSRSVRPKKISKPGDRKNYISFTRYKDDFNTGDDRIEYIVETSSDLRTWSSSGVSLDSNVSIGGGMERVTYKTNADRPAKGQQYIRVRLEAK
jgi:hypothetical protein